MRIDCKFYESRTYGSGDRVRACRLDLAPEAPWRCPADCPKYERRMVDAGWVQGSLANQDTHDEPDLDADTLALLDSAESIINAVGPEAVAEAQRERERLRLERARAARRRWWWPFGR